MIEETPKDNYTDEQLEPSREESFLGFNWQIGDSTHQPGIDLTIGRSRVVVTYTDTGESVDITDRIQHEPATTLEHLRAAARFDRIPDAIAPYDPTPPYIDAMLRGELTTSSHQNQCRSHPRFLPDCKTCGFYSGSGYLPCAVHPMGIDGDECNDWEAKAERLPARQGGNDRSPQQRFSRPTHYILSGHTPVPVEDVAEWARSFDNIRDVAKTEVDGVLVSTVFLGIDHRFFGDGDPILFETMCFALGDRGDYDFQARYSTWEEAEAGHWDVVEQLRSGVSVNALQRSQD